MSSIQHKMTQWQTRPDMKSHENKLADWSLTLKKTFIIIGDNVARLPVDNCPELQIDSFPGAKLQHAANLIEKATIMLEREKIFMSFGFNNCQQRFRIPAITKLQRVRNVADRSHYG